MLVLVSGDISTRASAPDPYRASCGWWACRKMGPCSFFGLCSARPHVPPDKLEEAAGEMEDWASLLGLLPPRPGPGCMHAVAHTPPPHTPFPQIESKPVGNTSDFILAVYNLIIYYSWHPLKVGLIVKGDLTALIRRPLQSSSPSTLR